MKTDLAVLTAGWIVPGHGHPPLRRGQVVVRGGRVVAVREAQSDLPAADLGPGVLLPGLVNAHCHLELSHLAGRIHARGDFVAWVEELVARRAAGAPEEEIRAAMASAVEALAAFGTAAVGDVSNRLANLDLLGQAPLHAVVFHELLAWDPEMAEAAMRAAEERLSAAGGPRPHPNVEIRWAAHAPHSVSPALFARLRKKGGAAAIHLAESPAEARFLATGEGPWATFLDRRGQGHVPFAPAGLSPVRHLDRLRALGPRTPLLAAHCVQTDAADHALLAERGVCVVLCPRSNARLGVGVPPLPALLSAGVRLSLGTDSLASAPDLDVLEDARALRASFPEVSPRILVEMATGGGAAALGLEDLGAIAPGRRAVFALAPAEHVPSDPYAFVLGAGVRTRDVRP